jgi:hypothetical protein
MMDITYETYSRGELTSWGNRVSGDLAATTLEGAATEILAAIAATPQRLRPPVDEIRLWRGASPARPISTPNHVQTVTA